MKKVILAALGLLLMAGAVFAQAPDTAYVGLFADVDRLTWSAYHIDPPMTDFMMYIYWLPSVDGFQGSEFKVSYPANVLKGLVTTNSRIVVSLGSLSTGISVVLAEGDCQPPGVWIETHHQECTLLSITPSIIEIVAHPTVGYYQVAICDENFSIRPVKKFTNLCLNSACATATESKTWGAIKSLF